MSSESDALRSGPSALRPTLAILLALVALNALGGGLYALSGAREVPVEWLAGTPFESYFVPGLILLLLVGGSAGIAAWMILRRSRYARTASLAAGVVLLIWIVVQVRMIGYVSWLQPTVGLISMLVLGLTLALPRAPRTN